ncbi:protein kinase domain-containing protein [Archaeoglobus sp.]
MLSGRTSVGKLSLILCFAVLLFNIQIISTTSAAEILWKHETVGSVRAIDFTPDGRYIVVGTTDGVSLLDRSGALVWHYSSSGVIKSLAVTPDGNSIVFVDSTGNLYKIDLNKNLLWGLKGLDIKSIVVTTNAIVAGTLDRILLIDFEGNILVNYKISIFATTLAASPDANFIVAGSDQYVYLIEISKRVKAEKLLVGCYVSSAAISPAKNLFVVGGLGCIDFYTIDGNLLKRQVVEDRINDIKITSDGKRVVAGGDDNYVRVFDSAGNLLWERETNIGVYSIAVSPESNFVVVGNWNEGRAYVTEAKLYIFDFEGNLIWSKRVGNDIRAISISPDEEYFAAGGEGDVLYFIEVQDLTPIVTPTPTVTVSISEIAEDKISEVEKIIEAAEAYNLTEPEKILEKAKRAYTLGNFQKAIELAEESKKKVEEILYKLNLTEKYVLETEEMLHYLGSRGFILVDVRNLLKEVNTSISRGEYSKALELSEQASKETEYAKNVIEEIQRLEKTINDAKNKGYLGLEEAESILTNAKNILANREPTSGEFHQAADLANQAKNIVERVLSEANEANSKISEAEQIINSTKNNPVGLVASILSNPNIKLKEAKKAFKNGNYSTAAVLAEKAKNDLNFYMNVLYAAVTVICFVVVLVSIRTYKKWRTEKERKLKITEALTSIEDAEKQLAQGSYLSAADKFIHALDLAEALEDHKIREMAVIGIEKINEYIDKAIEIINKYITEEKFDECERICNEIIELAEVVRNDDKKREIKSKLGEIEMLKVTKIKKDETKELLSRAQNLLRIGEYSKAVDILKKVLEISQAYNFEEFIKTAINLNKQLEEELNGLISQGDVLLSENRFDEAIKIYNSAKKLATALGKDKLIEDKVKTAEDLRDRKLKMSRFNELLKSGDEALDRKEYFKAAKYYKDASELASFLGLESKVNERLNTVKLKMENLVNRGDEAFSSSDYTAALRYYNEAFNISQAFGYSSKEIQRKIRVTEEKKRVEILQECLRISVPREMSHGESSEIKVFIINKFSQDLKVELDLSQNKDYFELNYEKIDFPPIKPGRTIGESLDVSPKFLGEFDFTIKVSSNFGVFTNIYPVKITEGVKVSVGTPTPSTPRAQIINPVDALSELYDDLQYIGEGGFAKVYKAKRRDGKVVALKVPQKVDPNVGKAFVREVTNWQNLKHPNIVELYDVNIFPVPHLEMEYCEDCLANCPKPMDVSDASLIIFNIAEGLKYAHSKKIIHRDLKPSNVLIKQGVPKISDWGLSKVIESDTSVTMTLGAVSHHYAAPEQIDKKFGHTDERSDIWQLGVIFYELVTGKRPFEGSLGEIINSILHKNPIPPSEFNPQAKKVEPIILKMLEKSKEDRYSDVKELQKDLAQILNFSYLEDLEKSKTIGNIKKVVYYLSDLILINLKTNNLTNAYKYISDIIYYISEDTVRKDVEELKEQIRFRLEERLEVPHELIEKAEVIIHKLKINML